MGFFNNLLNMCSSGVLAQAKITAQGENIKFDFLTPNNKNLIILLISYFTKVRWLLETEPEFPMQRIKDYYDEVLVNYPNVKKYNIFSPVAFGETQVFDIEVSKAFNRVGVINTYTKTVGGVDLVDSCFVLLKEIFKRLDENEKELLIASLLKLQPLIFLDKMDESFKGLKNAYSLIGVLARMITGGYWEYLDKK